ncbi:alkene reductase [Maribacter sp. HTCC2170]|uniref:alkene reductase n=1 Tax=Maribacter sp. (strain HTCC2170 / KCCM 42371) TaxID=313603 RepID=UPI00006BB12C|nr:alkene reductase [Maribacter sp. HTCC2170]EAQ99628.1 NADH-dependent flavin oxidoreductase, Oye family protein [Maribacter sp. HTCC2170]
MNLFKFFPLGNTTLKNRIVMAPMTRSRAIGNIPNELMAEYYQQRASAGLIISEGTSPSPNGLGYPRIPGAYSDDQILGWKKVADAVHAKDGKIFIQLMHTGRITAKANLPVGSIALAPSSIQAPGEMFTDTDGMVAHDTPKAMTLEEIETVKNEFVNSAKRLINEADIDGIELHAANGYLLNQFINPNSNQRVDSYGGSIVNRTRLVLEVAEAVVAEIGSDKVGIRFSPYGAFNDMLSDYEDLEDTFVYLSKELKKMNIAYINVVDQRVAFGAPDFITDIKKTIKHHFKRTVISGGDIDSIEKAEGILDSGLDLVYVGRPFISNPNFVEKLQNGTELTAPDMNTFYSPGENGYTDY